MFIIYRSNDLNILLSQVYKIIKKDPLSNIFEKEIFIHDNKILFQYLNVFIAQKIGISANFKLYHPNYFIWKLLQKILFKKNSKNIFSSSIMIWKIMNILDKKTIFELFNIKKDETKKFKLAFLMANIFEKYLFYRPDWINSWETEENILNIDDSEKWQIKLWKKIIYNTKKINQSNYHFAYLFNQFQLFFNKKKIKKNSLTVFSLFLLFR